MKELLTQLLIAVITVSTPIITAYLVKLINKTAENATAGADDIKVKGYIEEIAKAITDAVSATSQTYVDALKQAGKFTKEAQAEAAQKALTACLASISPTAQAFIENVYGDSVDYLTTKIESEVRRQKIEAPATLALPVQTAISQLDVETKTTEN
jgi:hypothetical protein